MRVPIPLALFLCLAVVGSSWWYGTRDDDFLTPPSASKLAAITQRVESSLPPADHLGDAVSVPPEAREATEQGIQESPKPIINPDDLSRPPSLYEYADVAAQGTAYLIDLAGLLENKGQPQRALIAWERVLDACKPNDVQANSAIISIKRLKPALPPWNTDPSQAIPVTLHAGTGEGAARLLTPILEETASELERASSGILKVTAAVTAGRGDLTAAGSPPVALWFVGMADDSRSTEVLSFTMDSPETLHEKVRKTVFSILRGYLARETSLTPPRPIGAQSTPLEALNTHISRRSWQELGNMLNLPR